MSAARYREDWEDVISNSAPMRVTYTREPGLDVELAIRLLYIKAKDCIPLGAKILTRAAQHLEDRLEQELFGPTIRIQELGQAMAMIKGLGVELQHGADALHMAAQGLNGIGKVQLAHDIYAAHKRLQARAQEILDQ